MEILKTYFTVFFSIIFGIIKLGLILCSIALPILLFLALIKYLRSKN